MSGLKKYLRTALVGGVLVALPIFLLTNLFLWLLGWLNRSLAPVSRFIVGWLDVSPWFGDLIALATAVTICFALGAVVSTRAGHRAFTWLEEHTLQRLPGYSPIKEIVGYIGRNDRNPFSRPVLVTIGNVGFVGFLSDERGESCTVFLPTGPNPTTGLVVHVPRSQVEFLNVSSTAAMKTILACGAGAQDILPQRLAPTSVKNWPSA
jgi:uncharacterized membrane protein